MCLACDHLSLQEELNFKLRNLDFCDFITLPKSLLINFLVLL